VCRLMSACFYDTDSDVYLKGNQLAKLSESKRHIFDISELSVVTDWK